MDERHGDEAPRFDREDVVAAVELDQRKIDPQICPKECGHGDGGGDDQHGTNHPGGAVTAA